MIYIGNDIDSGTVSEIAVFPFRAQYGLFYGKAIPDDLWQAVGWRDIDGYRLTASGTAECGKDNGQQSESCQR